MKKMAGRVEMAGKSLKWRDVALNGGKNPSPIPLAYR